MIVLDASVAVKLVIREADTAQAQHWFRLHSAEAISPDLIAIEVAQVVVRRVNMRAMAIDQGRAILTVWHRVLDERAIDLVRMLPSHIADAADLALRLGHPVKDCIYLALAIDRRCDLITCDAKFAVKARTLYPDVKLLSDHGN